MSRLKHLVVVALVLLAAACAGGPAPAGSGPREDPDVITEADLMRYGSVPVRQAIERLRPRFLRSRGPSSIYDRSADIVVVYLGDTRMGSIEFLDQVMTNEIREVRYLSAPDATQRYGTGHSAGAIILIPR